MPYKNQDKQREAVREAVRRFRERKKEKENKIGTTEKQYILTVTKEFGTPTQAELEKYSQISKLFDEAVDLVGIDEAIKLLKTCLQQQDKEKDSFKKMTSFIPDLLSMHVDLKTLKQRGGTPCL